jgi:predicted nuclease with TOPRIM domain
MADKCVACVRASKDPKTHTDDLHHAELLRVNGRCAQLGFDLESAQSLNEDLKTRLLAAERELNALRDRFMDAEREHAKLSDQRNALAAALRSIVNRFRYVDSQWIVDARAALQALKADNPPTETRGG